MDIPYRCGWSSLQHDLASLDLVNRDAAMTVAPDPDNPTTSRIPTCPTGLPAAAGGTGASGERGLCWRCPDLDHRRTPFPPPIPSVPPVVPFPLHASPRRSVGALFRDGWCAPMPRRGVVTVELVRTPPLVLLGQRCPAPRASGLRTTRGDDVPPLPRTCLLLYLPHRGPRTHPGLRLPDRRTSAWIALRTPPGIPK